MLKAARSERDEAKRRSMYYELQEIVHNDGGVAIPVFASFLHAASDRLGHGDVSGISYMDYFHLARKVVVQVLIRVWTQSDQSFGIGEI